jgi:hypothetical protein
MGTVEIINGDHEVAGAPFDAKHAFIIINRIGLHVDLNGVGQLWDHQTVRHVFWGIRDERDRVCGRIELKNGVARLFYDAHLMVPYVDAYNAALERHRSSEAIAEKSRADQAIIDKAIDDAREKALAALQRKPALPPMQEQQPR